ncbi:SDR family oxidoreductase [Myxococcota bacterium]|nr:SDR family oxidoreductase [Myxococcota bacterium]
MGRVDGKVVIITGAASGLGEADARLLSAEGASVIMTDINEEAGQTIAGEIGAEFVRQDVSEEAGWTALIDQVMERHGRLDVLVNNAGIAIIADVLKTTTDIWRRTLAVHLDGTFFGCRHALPAMKQGGGGSIINMSSTAALVGLSPYFAYSAAKGGIRSLTKSVAIYCRERKNGIRCNSIHPGSIDTPMVEAALAGLQDVKLAEQRDREATRIAMGLGEPSDVAYLVLYLASDESKHVTGAELVVDNGDTAV